MSSSITTREGDSGKTSTLDGERIDKNDLRVEVPGKIEQLTAHLSTIKLRLSSKDARWHILTWIQTCCFVISANASDPYNKTNYTHKITEEEVKFLEDIIQRYEEKNNMPQGFIIPGTNELSCMFNTARTLIRNIECSFISLWHHFINHQISSPTLAFLNRLSDIFFILSCEEEHGNFCMVDYSLIKELPKKMSNFGW